MTGIPRTDLEVSNWAHPEPGVWILWFPWEKNPLPMNGSYGHHQAHAKKVRHVKDRARYIIRAANIPTLGRCEAQLTWWVANNRVRDEDNLGALEKPLFDALVLEHVVADDKPTLMTKPRGRIRHLNTADGLVTGPCFTLTIRHLDSEAAS